MKKIIAIFSILVVSLTAYSQDNCNCENTMEELVLKIEKEYPGFKEKTPNEMLYNSFKAKMISKSKETQDFVCLKLLREYISFFQDLHITIRFRGEIKQKGEKVLNSNFEKLNVDISQFTKDIQNTKDKLEGIWESPNYKVGIIKSKENVYKGFIIDKATNNWKLNDVKFKLYSNNIADYFMGDHSLQKESYKIDNNCLLSFPGLQSLFIKKTPAPTLSEKQIEQKRNKLEGFYFKVLSSKTAYIKISSFNYPYIKRIEKLIEDNKASIENHEYLIIDLRDNGGGTGLAYQKLLPYIYTNPVRDIGQEFLVTPTLISGLQKYLKEIAVGDEYESDRKRIRKNLEQYKGNSGKFINPDSTAVTIGRIKVPKHSPSQIVILSNKKVGSSAEVFLYKVKQSKKVKILGTPSMGVIDYASVRWFDDFRCKNYTLYMPTTRSFRIPDFPLDNIGVQPDVYLDKSVENWIDFSLKYLEN